MEVLELVILGVVLLVSILVEKIFFVIHPMLWRVGGIVALIFSILGIGIVSWQEAVICFVISFILMLIAKPLRYMGGGGVKGLLMCALYLGRYVFVTYVIFGGIGMLMARIIAHQKKPKLPGSNLKRMMPLVTVSVVITVVVMYWLTS